MYHEGDGIIALREERAFVDLSDRRKVRVSGADAVPWLHDLLTADIASLPRGGAVRSLLLSPTGRIRADVHVTRGEGDVLILQEPAQREHIGLLLHPYLLSSDVRLEDATHDLAVLSVLGAAARLVGRPGTSPSALGPGVDVITPTGKPAWRVEDALVKADLVEAGPDDVEAWRVLRGLPRMGMDFGEDSLPAEAGLETAIDFTKGCFLGQESVARVRNLGHPPRVLRHVSTDGELRPGEVVLSGVTTVGEVTSAAIAGGETVAIVRVRWEAADATLALPDGRVFRDIPHMH